MLLQDIAEEFCQTPVFYYDGTAWLESPVLCRFPPYDRFISDRAFGQKKRLVQTPGGKLLPGANYYRVGSLTGRIYMVESVNEDLDQDGEYLNIYMVREATDEVIIEAKQEIVLPSKVKTWQWVESARVWGDYDRYGTLNSTVTEAAYTSYTLSLPSTVVIPPDARLVIDGSTYTIIESWRQLDLRQYRLRGVDGQA